MYLEEAQKEFSAAGASDRVQQAMDAVLEIRLAQRRAEAAGRPPAAPAPRPTARRPQPGGV